MHDRARGASELQRRLEQQQYAHPRRIDLTLERVLGVARVLGVDRPAHPAILIAGTNGKGSTTALIDALARAAGLRTGMFTSPHLRRYSERIVIDGCEARDDELLAAFDRIDAARGSTTLTFFEYSTLAAFDLFSRAGVDLAVIEVGLGGRLDATNLIDADVAVLCSVGLDHCEWLGTTREAIGAEKAGIFRGGRPVVLGSADMPQSVHNALANLRCDARWPDRDFVVEVAGPHWRWRGRRWSFDALPAPALPGAIQYVNAATALAALEALAERRLPRLDARLDAACAARALQGVRLPGRFQLVRGAPSWILDVAHNPAAAEVLAAALRASPAPPGGRTLAVCGILGDKDASGIAHALRGVIDEWIVVGLAAEPRGLDAEASARRLGDSLPIGARVEGVDAACEAALARARTPDRIVVFGSFHTVGPALDWLEKRSILPASPAAD